MVENSATAGLPLPACRRNNAAMRTASMLTASGFPRPSKATISSSSYNDHSKCIGEQDEFLLNLTVARLLLISRCGAQFCRQQAVAHRLHENSPFRQYSPNIFITFLQCLWVKMNRNLLRIVKLQMRNALPDIYLGIWAVWHKFRHQSIIPSWPDLVVATP